MNLNLNVLDYAQPTESEIILRKLSRSSPAYTFRFTHSRVLSLSGH